MLYQRIRYFLQVAESGSFSRAAQQLYLSPQALMKQVSLLEDELGGALLLRSPQGVRLTPLGEAAQRELARLMQDCDKTIASLRRLSQENGDRVRIGIFSALPQAQITTPFVALLLANGYHLELELLNTDVGKKKLLSGEIDLLLTHIHEEERWDGCRRLSFQSFEAQVCVSLCHPWVMKEQLTPEDLAKEAFIKMQADNSNYTVPAGQGFYDRIPCREIIPVHNFETMLALLEQCSGFAVFPMFFSNMEHTHYKAFPYPGPPLRFDLCLVFREALQNSAALRAVQVVREEYALSEL